MYRKVKQIGKSVKEVKGNDVKFRKERSKKVIDQSHFHCIYSNFRMLCKTKDNTCMYLFLCLHLSFRTCIHF